MNGPGQLQRIINGDCRTVLKELPPESVQCVVTSPPYWGLRDYGHADQIGLEETPQAYVETMRQVFAEVWRVLRDDGTVWLNLGDSYSGSGKGGNPEEGKQATNRGSQSVGTLYGKTGETARLAAVTNVSRRACAALGIKPKDLCMIPARVALALQSDGWWLRSEITWCKKVPMPESVRDRPTSATEKIFLLTKSASYFYDSEAVRNPPSDSFANDSRWKTGSTPHNEKNGYAAAGAQNPKQLHRMFDKKPRGHERDQPGIQRWDAMSRDHQMAYGSNMRNFWVLGPEPCKAAHFATFPSEIPRRCILAGTKPGDVVLDPFGGSGTTGMVAIELGRRAVLIELNPEYAKLCDERCRTTPGLPLETGLANRP